jgi:hypothetical protein
MVINSTGATLKGNRKIKVKVLEEMQSSLSLENTYQTTITTAAGWTGLGKAIRLGGSEFTAWLDQGAVLSSPFFLIFT